MKFVIYEIWTTSRVIEAESMAKALEKNIPTPREGLDLSNWHAVSMGDGVVSPSTVSESEPPSSEQVSPEKTRSRTRSNGQRFLFPKIGGVQAKTWHLKIERAITERFKRGRHHISRVKLRRHVMTHVDDVTAHQFKTVIDHMIENGILAIKQGKLRKVRISKINRKNLVSAALKQQVWDYITGLDSGVEVTTAEIAVALKKNPSQISRCWPALVSGRRVVEVRRGVYRRMTSTSDAPVRSEMFIEGNA